MARGVGGFASGLSRGIRTGMEMRQFKREEDEYKYQVNQRELHKELSGAIPTAEDLNVVQPIGDMNVDGYAIPADTFTGGQPQPASGQGMLNELDKTARAQLDPARAAELRSEIYKARTQAFTLAANSYFTSKSPEDKLQSLQLAYQYLGFEDGAAPFAIGEDGSITHTIEGLQDADGNPLPIEAVLANAATQLSENPAALFPLMDERMRQHEAEATARDDRMKAEEHRVFLREQEAAQTRAAEKRVLIAEEAAADNRAYYLAALEADTLETERRIAMEFARANGMDPESIGKALTRMDRNWEASYAELSQDPVYGEFVAANPQMVRNIAPQILAANPSPALTDSAMQAAMRIAALLGDYELTEEQLEDPRNQMVLRRVNGGIAWVNPLTNDLLMLPDALVGALLGGTDAQLGTEDPAAALPDVVEEGSGITTRGQRKQNPPPPRDGFNWEPPPVVGSVGERRRGGFRDNRALPDVLENPLEEEIPGQRYDRAYR